MQTHSTLEVIFELSPYGTKENGIKSINQYKSRSLLNVETHSTLKVFAKLGPYGAKENGNKSINFKLQFSKRLA